MDGPASGAQTEIASDIADVNRSSPGFRVHCATDIVEMNSAATTLRFQSAGNASGHNIAAFGFDLHEFHIARNRHIHFGRELVRRSAFPFPHNPGGIAAHVRADFVRLELTPCPVFGSLVRFAMDHIADSLRGPALHSHRTGFNLNAKIVGSLK